ncbi:caspase-3-like isoform X4 [Hydractinia symbiolongicarpus]|uniref:caspase-3-like isoform X4 n=1 Tax=Hydractinia symbiolongicarpus TaxID=13093 RepID=UPI002551A273|nr:caspase-3-like isoform X4 [Hydractinia symbiolongicarpus]
MSVNIGGNVGNLQVATNINTTTTQNFIDSTPQDAVSSSSPQPSSVTGTPLQTRNWPGTINETAEPQNQDHRLLEAWMKEPPGFVHDMETGYVFIINNEDFVSLPTRNGSSVDVKALTHFFSGVLHWEDVEVVKNRTAEQIRNEVKEFSLMDFTNYSAFFLVVLSHGTKDGVLGVDEEAVSIESMLKYFNANLCPTLANKPKIFIIQGHRGDLDDEGISVVQTDAFCEERSKMINIPEMSDFLITYPCIPGYTALNHGTEGTYFIQTLALVFSGYYDKEHIVDLLLRVNFVVSGTLDVNTTKKAMPCSDMRLRRKCYFHAYILKMQREMQKHVIPDNS